MSTKAKVSDTIKYKEIRNILRHRHPFLLVDKILELTEDSVIGIKNITGTDPVLEGHFPDEPIYPGVLLIEACSQVGGVLVSKQLTGNGYIAKVNDFRFYRFLEPGDAVRLVAHSLKKLGGYASVKVEAYVENKVVAKGEITYTFK